MTTRKRRPPEKRQAGRTYRLVTGSAALAGAAIMRKPALTGGTIIFTIVFSFVAANALWYQPSAHPHPWIDTRGTFKNYVANAMSSNQSVTTFIVEHDRRAAEKVIAELQAGNLSGSAKPASAVQGQSIATEQVIVQEPEGDATAAGAASTAKSDIVAAVQSNLARRGLYDGSVDGIMGPKTAAAIIFYQETRGLKETGEASPALLNLLQKDNSEFDIIPSERPTPDVTGAIESKKAPDPVAKLIKAAPANKPVPPKPIAKAVQLKPEPAKVQLASAPVAEKKAPSKDLVTTIQKGLSNLAYRDVEADGILGQQTRDAISHFEKHYRLPVTGEPNEAVLKKLKQIGAL